MTDLTSEQLAELVALEKAATPGEWKCALHAQDADSHTLTGPEGCLLRKIDARLIAALRNAAPALLRDAARYRWLRDGWWLDPKAELTPAGACSVAPKI